MDELRAGEVVVHKAKGLRTLVINACRGRRFIDINSIKVYIYIGYIK